MNGLHGIFGVYGKLKRLANSSTANAATVNSSAVNVANVDQFSFLVALGALDASADVDVVVQGYRNAAWEDTNAQVTGLVDADDDKLVAIDVVRPHLYEQLRVNVVRNAGTFDVDMIGVLESGTRRTADPSPITQDATVKSATTVYQPTAAS